MADMFEELKAWADKWKVPYCARECDAVMAYIDFEAETCGIPPFLYPTFSYNKETGDFAWYGGD